MTKKCKKHNVLNCQKCKFGGNNKMLNIIIISITSLIILNIILITEVNAESNIIHIAIEFSEGCESLIRLNDLETCSYYEYLNSIYPNTKLKQSYQISIDNARNDEQTDYQTRYAILQNKIQCVSKNYCEVFDRTLNQEVMYWYSPENEIRKHLDGIITIYPNMLVKNIKNDPKESIFIDNGTTRQVSFNTNRLYIDSGCRNISYNPLIINEELGRIIWYVYNNCRDDSMLGKLKDNYLQTIDKHILDITTSPNWQYEQDLKEKKENCKEICKEY